MSRMISHYDDYYQFSIAHPSKFWAEMALRTLIWDTEPTRDKVMAGLDMSEGKIHFFGGTLNATGM